MFNASVSIRQIVLLCSNAGTSWTIKIQDRAGTPAILIAPVTITVASGGFPAVQAFDNPLPMDNGIDFVTLSGTAGVVDVWISIEQPNT